jgi:thymidylate synthase
MNLGDVHIYKQHYNAVEEQISRMPYSFPKLFLEKDINTIFDLEKLQFEDFRLENYQSYPSIKAEMVA